METTEQKIIAKQKELIEHLGRGVFYDNGFKTPEWKTELTKLKSALQLLEQQLSEERKQGEKPIKMKSKDHGAHGGLGSEMESNSMNYNSLDI